MEDILIYNKVIILMKITQWINLNVFILNIKETSKIYKGNILKL
jgi:hypothetical protein